MKLTDQTVRKLELPAGKPDHIVFDADLSGFGLRLRAGGKKTWVAQYRFGRDQRRFNIGSVQEVNATNARKTAADIFAKVRLGIDPQAERKSAIAKAADTLGAVSELYLEAIKAGRGLRRKDRPLRSSSYEAIERHLEKHWAAIKSVSVHSITRKDVARELTKISTANGPIAANRARATLSSFFSWAMREGLVDINPVIGSNRAIERPRTRVLTEQELVEVWKAAGGDDYGRIVRLLILTAQRRDEVGGLAEDELDLKGRLWTIPADRTKNGRRHEIPLCDAALEILHDVPRREGRNLLFGRGTNSYSGWSKAKASLDKTILGARQGKAELVPWTIHDIRRTVATRLQDSPEDGGLGVLPHIVEAILNHISGAAKGGVAGVYNHALYRAEKRQALDRWAEHIRTLVEGAERKVVPMILPR